MEFEDPNLLQAREQQRASLAARTGELLHQLRDWTAEERLAWHREHRGHFFFGTEERHNRIRVLNDLLPSRRGQLIAAAERLLRHEFDILGSGPVCLGERIDWQRDFKSGVRWRNDVIYPAWNWRKVNDPAGKEMYRGHFYSIEDASDLKVPWDLSSFFHLPTLAEAFLQTGDPRYAREVIDQLRDWHQENPYPRGVNWTCAMVVGIRLANVIFSLRLIEPPDFLGETGVSSILLHLKFILDSLEVDEDGRRNNHYLNNLVGLGFGGAEVARTDLGCELLDFVFEELKRELVTQFSADGTNYEGSIPYHRFAAESLIVTAILLERNGRQLPPQARVQLKRIVRFIDHYTKPNGLAPQVGDNDNGRVLVLHDYAEQEYRDHRHILAVGATWLCMNELATEVSDQVADVIWLVGQRPAVAAPVGKAPFIASLHNRNGYALAKTTDSSFLVRCGEISAMSGGGHNHCDQLSFEFHDQRQDLIVDPGAMVYSADATLRNQFRSTAAHNLLQLDDLEQQGFNPQDLFAMQDRAAARVDAWEIEDTTVFFRGQHTGYQAAGWKILRECRCNLREGKLHVRDIVEPLAPVQRDDFCGRLHLAAGIQVDQAAPSAFLLQIGNHQWIVRFEEGLHCRQTQGQVSSSYGVTLRSVILEYRFAANERRSAGFIVERVVP